jgi:hypothetical protein
VRIIRNTAWRIAGAALVGGLVAMPAVPALAGTPAPGRDAAPAGTRVTGVANTSAHPAGTVRPLATRVTVTNPLIVKHGRSTVTIRWGYDYNPANNHLRGYALMVSNNRRTHLQAEPLNLGDRRHVLKSARANSRTGRLLVETGAVSCHKPGGVYQSNLHYSIRWPNGEVSSLRQTGVFQTSARRACRA